MTETDERAGADPAGEAAPLSWDWALPPAMSRRARQFAESGAAAAPARPAASVVLLRPEPAEGRGLAEVRGLAEGHAPAEVRGPAGKPGAPLVYLVRRARTMAFASGMYAFLGGGVAPADAAGPELPPERARRLGLSGQRAAALLRAAVREVREESGVLLAADRLFGWARWITPEFEPRRFDAWFFLAELPAGQRAEQVGGESDASCWLTPAAALAAHRAGELDMLPPTATILRELSGFATVAEALAAAGRREVAAAVRPRIVSGADGALRMVYP